MTVQFQTKAIQEIAIGDVVRKVGRVTFIHDTGSSFALFFGQETTPMIVPKEGEWTAEVVTSA